MLKLKQLSGGFTLLELLVVISIIGILMAMGVVAFSTAQQKGRDAKRRGDMEALQDAQEQYYAANGSYGSESDLTSSGDYINTIPKDPQSSQNYMLDFSSGAADYCACADLEEDKGNNNDQNCSSGWNEDGTGSYFCVSNLQ